MKKSIEDRIKDASAILGITDKQLKDLFSVIDDISLIEKIIDSMAHSEIKYSLECALDSRCTIAQCYGASNILKGVDNSVVLSTSNTTIEKLIEATKPIANWSDEELLIGYLQNETQDLEFELNKRSRGRRFIIMLKNKTDMIDIEASLMMLKRARKEEIPSVYKTSENEVIRIYRIEEYHPDNRVRYISPLRPNSVLFDGFCSECGQNFSNVKMDARQYLYLIHDRHGSFDRNSERNLVKLAEKGVDSLKEEYPEIIEEYEDKLQINALPVLVKYESVASRLNDPFYPNKKAF